MCSKGVNTLRRGIAVIAAGLALGLLAVTPAFAGMGGSVVPSFPTPMNVGDIKTASVTITNHATSPNNVESVNVSGIFFTPSCASSDGFTCLTPDPGVFQFATFIGKSGTACASTVFTAGAPDPGTGEFQLIPPAGSPVVLGPSSVGGPKATCVITMNFQVLRAPNDSTPPNPPLTTDSLARATLQGAISGRSGSASGGATTQINAPNLTIDKAPHTPGQMINAGSVASFTITVGNTGTGTANSVTLSDPLPAGGRVTWGVTSQDAGFSCSITGASPQVLNCGPLNLPIGQTKQVVVSATTTLAACTTMDNFATVRATNNATVPPAEGLIICSVPQADLSIVKTDGATTYVPGGTTTYTMTVTNKGPSAVTNATVTDTFPAAITSATWTCVASAGSSCTAGSGSGNISTTVGLLVNGTATFTVTANISASATGNLVNAGTVTPPPLTNNPGTACTAAGSTYTAATGSCTSTDTDRPAPVADLSIVKTDGTTTYVPGGTTTYTLTVTNKGPTVVTNAAVTDTFPAAITSAAWTCAASAGSSCTAASGSGNISTTVSLLVNGTATFTVTASISAAATGTLINAATVTPPAGTTNLGTASTAAGSGYNAGTGSCTSTDTDTPAPTADLSIVKTDGVTVVTAGTLTTYTITVTNKGPSTVALAPVTDTFPAAITSATWTCSATAGSSCTAASGTGNINTTVSLVVNGVATFTVTANISAAATGTLVNSATVTPPSGTTNPGTACTAASSTYNAATGSCTSTDTDTITSPCSLSIDATCSIIPVTAYSCTSPNVVTQLTMRWGGGDPITGSPSWPVSQPIWVRATAGGVTTVYGGVSGITVGSLVTVGAYNAADKTSVVNGPAGTVVWNIYGSQADATAGGTNTIGQSKFSVSCADAGMSGADDCFLPAGEPVFSGTAATCTINGAAGKPCTNNWILEKITGSNQTLDCDALADGSGQPEAGCEVAALGGQVTYQYTVHNNSSTAAQITITDSTIAPPSYVPGVGPTAVTLPSNNSQVYTRTSGTITAATKSTATVHGNTTGGVDQCSTSDSAFVVPQCFLGDPVAKTAYPYGSGRTNTAFAESTVVKDTEPTVATIGGTVRVWYSDEHALSLGISNVTLSGSACNPALNPPMGCPTTGAFTVTPFPTTNAAMVTFGAPSGTLALSAGKKADGSNASPWFTTPNTPGTDCTLGVGLCTALPVNTGASSCPGGCDPSGRPVAPAMFCTDITSANTNKGDWQIAGGMGRGPDFVSGTWKSATTTVTCSTVSGVYDCRPVTTVGTDPQDNVTQPNKTPVGWNAGPNAEAPQGGSYSFLNTTTSVQLESYGTETRWNVGNTTLTCIDGATGNPIPGGFQSGHTYRVQLLTHDGDQNGTGGDAGESCSIIALP